MEKVFHFHFDSVIGPYRSDAVAVYCFDDRFTLVVQKFLKRLRLERVDTIRVAGGARALASPDGASEKNFLLEQLRLSRKLHDTGRVILIAHSDCGACGGLARFNHDAIAEAEHHRSELARAAASVRSAIPEVEVECFFADFFGVWRAETARSAGFDQLA
jgi:carbonic anhydrase